MSSKINIQNANKTFDKIELDFLNHSNKDLAKIVCLKLPDAELFRLNYLNSNKIEFRLTEALFKFNEFSEKISELDQTHQLANQFYDMIHVLDDEIQKFSLVNGTWFNLEKYFQKVCFIKLNQEDEDIKLKGNLHTDLDFLENLKCENKNLEIKLFNSEKEIYLLKKELDKQAQKNEKTELELDHQLTRTIELSLEFKKKTEEIEKKLKDLNEEQERLHTNRETNKSS